MLIVTVIPDTNNGEGLTFGICHYILGIYGVSFLYRDIVLIGSRKSIKTFFKFWRIYDLLMHCLLFTGILMRFLTYQDVQKFIHGKLLNNENFEETAVRNSLMVSRILLSLTATLSLNR